LGALTVSGAKITESFVGVILLVALALVSYTYVRPLYDPWAKSFQRAGRVIDRLAPPDALAVYAVSGDSSGIYYGRRKGWHAFDDSDWGEPLDSEQAIIQLERLKELGARFLVFTRYTVWWLEYYTDFQEYLDSRHRRVSDTRNYVIFDLTSTSLGN
jgi:hypothetical protein